MNTTIRILNAISWGAVGFLFLFGLLLLASS